MMSIIHARRRSVALRVSPLILALGAVGARARPPEKGLNFESEVSNRRYRLEFEPAVSGKPFEALSARVDLRARVEKSAKAPYDDAQETEIREAWLRLKAPHVQATAGFQQFALGELFGAPVLDIYSPRDFRDYLLEDPAVARLATASLRLQIFAEDFSATAVATPFPRIDKIDGLTGQLEARPAETEGYLQLRGRFAGLEAQLIGMATHNRDGDFLLDTGTGLIQRHLEREYPVGLGLNYAVEEAVIRAEALVIPNYAITGIDNVTRHRLQLRSGLGLDIDFGDQAWASVEVLASAAFGGALPDALVGEPQRFFMSARLRKGFATVANGLDFSLSAVSEFDGKEDILYGRWFRADAEIRFWEAWTFLLRFDSLFGSRIRAKENRVAGHLKLVFR